jgi:hypothetical protein
MGHIRKDFIEKAEKITGMEIRYSSIRPNIFGSFDIRNLRLIKDGDVFISVSRARISFSLFELLRGKKAAIHSIQLDRPSISLDVEKDRKVLDLLSSAFRRNERRAANSDKELIQQIAEFFPNHPYFRIRNCFFSLKDGGTVYQIHDMNIDITGDGGEIFLSGKFGAELGYTGPFKEYSVKTEVGINGSCSADFERGRAEIALSSTIGAERERKKSLFSLFKPAAKVQDIPLFHVRPLNFAVDFKDRTLSLRPSGENSAFSGSFDYNTDTGGLYASLDSHNFPIADLVKFSEARKDINRLLSIPITGGASFRYENSGAVMYNADFGGESSGSSFTIRARGNEKRAVVENLRFFSPVNADPSLFYGEFKFSGSIAFAPFSPDGTFVFDRFSLTGEEGFSAVFTASGRKNEIQIKSEKALMGQAEFDNIDIYLFPSDKDLSAVISVFPKGGGQANIDAILNYSPRQLEASLALDSFSAAYIAQTAGQFSPNAVLPPAVRGFLKNTVIDAAVFFNTDFKQIVYNAPNITVESGRFKGMFSFAGTNRQFTLSEGIFSRDGRDFLVSANFNFSNPMDLVFSLYINYLDFSWQIEGQVLDMATLIIRDPNGLHAYGSVSSSGSLSGYFEAVDFPFPVNGKPVYLNLYAALRYSSGDFWSFDIARFSARRYNSPDREDFLRFSGSADQDGASFKNMLYTDDIGSLSGGADFSWNRDFSRLNFTAAVTDGREEGEYCFAEGSVDEGHFSVNASVSDMRLDRFTGGGSMLLNGQAGLSWDSLNSFNARLNISSLYGVLYENKIQASAGVLFTNDEFTIRDLRLDYANINAYLPIMQFNCVEGFAKASADIKGFIFKKRFDGIIELDANFARMDSWMDIGQAFNSIDGSIQTKNIHYGGSDAEPFSFEFSRNEGAISVSGGPRNMLRLEMDRDGIFFTSLSAPFPIRTSVAGKYSRGYIDAHCADFFMDLSALWSVFPPMRGFAIPGGYITAKLDIRGPVTNPEFFGKARGSSIRFQVPEYISQDIRPVPFDAVLEGYEMIFGPVPVVIGGGGGTVGGWLRFDNWIPKNIGLDISVPRNTPIPYGFNISGFLANGDVSGKLVVVLENSLMEISGDVYANNAELGLSIDDIMQARSERDSVNSNFAVAIDITVTTGSVVEFTWPNPNMPILRANPEMGTVLSVKADTMSGQYSLNSDITIRSGELYYFDRSFYIRRGNLVFMENEQHFNPRLSARAEIKDRTDSGPVTISMIIENEPLLNFIPRFEASPVLTQLEIYSLLGQNLYGINLNDGVDTAQRFLLTSGADIFTQFVSNSDFFATRQFERQVRNFLHLDMFSVRSRILQNAVSNATVTLGQPPVDRNSRVGNYFDNTTVFVGKYIGQDMFIQGMLSMRYDENYLALGGLRFEPDIGIELQSPLFNIRWDFFPYHPENWWVNDNSITLTWSKSF